MKRIITLWLTLTLLVAGRVAGQETDSLFFRADSLSLPLTGLEKGHPVEQQRVGAESFMRNRIYFTSDFIRRFTGCISDSTSLEANTLLSCETRLRSLFDAEDVRLQRTTGQKDTYTVLTHQFVEAVCGAQLARGLPDLNEQLYAEVLAQLTEPRRNCELKLYLKKGRTGENWAWEVIGADAAEWSAADSARPRVGYRDSLAFIAPNAHELNFMGWAKQLRSGNDLLPFIHPASAGDAQLTAIAQRLATGQLRLQTLQTTALWLNTQLGWALQLRQFNRETDNSGWLISDLCRLDKAPCLPPVLHRFMTTNALRKP